MPAPSVLICEWVRSAVVPVNGAFRALHAHEIAAPVVQALLQRAGLPNSAVDALVMGNALGAGGNPARMTSLAAELPDGCPALSVDTQCCSGLDAVGLAASMIASGQAEVVIAGGAEAWSRAPIRHHRPLFAGEPAVSYERPPFAPDKTRDPDLLQAAADFAGQRQYSRAQQNAYAQQSHLHALRHRLTNQTHIVPVSGVVDDAYPRNINTNKLERFPLAAASEVNATTEDCGLSQLALSVKADGAAFVLLMSESACKKYGCRPKANWLAHCTVGHPPERPFLAAEAATQALIGRTGLSVPQSSVAVELHDAFAVQGISFAQKFNLHPGQLNSLGGGLARGHPIGASGAVALVQLLTRLAQSQDTAPLGLACIAAAGGLGSAALIQTIRD